MCIIAVKSKGVDMPSEDTLRTMWVNNPHGAGIMYADGSGKVLIDKGYMDWTSFIGRIKALGEPEIVKEMAVVLHFRIATHGGINPSNTHPFPVSERIRALKKLRGACKVGVAHNGIIPIVPRKGISDTMEFIASELAPMAERNPKWYKSSETLERIGERIRSKLAVLDGSGYTCVTGEFIEEKGVWYSNTSFRPRVSAITPFRDARPYEIDTEDIGTTDIPWRWPSVWLMPVDECDSGNVVRVGDHRPIADTEDLWCSRTGRVYAIDYDDSIAYRLDNLTCTRAPMFANMDAVKFDDGGVLNAWPF